VNRGALLPYGAAFVKGVVVVIVIYMLLFVGYVKHSFMLYSNAG